MNMRFITQSIYLLCFLTIITAFKAAQQKYPRVRKAYADKATVVKQLLATKNIKVEQANLYLRAFKEEKVMELWAKNKSDQAYQLVKEFEICETSGEIGPKRRQGDFQIPEGYYHISAFNPYSNFYLSLKVNYPNPSDRILHTKGYSTGGDIYIHGSCVTIGCLPIQDEFIKELYVLCVEAKNNGQGKIPITIFPAKLNDSKYLKLKENYSTDTDKLGLWEDLKKGYDYFNKKHTMPSITFLDNGRHQVK